MKLHTIKENIETHKSKAVIIGAFEDDLLAKPVGDINRKLDNLISKIIKDNEFKGKERQRVLIHTQSKLKSERVILVGLGKKEDFNLEVLRRVSGSISKYILNLGISSYTNAVPLSISSEIFKTGNIIQTIIEGSFLGSYRFDRYKTKFSKDDLTNKIKDMTVLLMKDADKKETDRGLFIGDIISKAVIETRDFVSMPGNLANPKDLANWAKGLSKTKGIKVTINDEKEIKKLKMGAFLAVAQGSIEPPRLITIEYNGTSKKKSPYVLIGKGLTFDSGGISLKPAKGMEEMKTDMSGGAAVIGALTAISKLKLPVNVVGIVGATENMPGGRSYKPGDVLTSMSGVTIEVLNTDAEGRLVLADLLTYAKKFKPRNVVNLATLTGSCVIALGYEATGIMGNNSELINALISAGNKTGERLWELPLWDSYDGLIKSSIADVKNIGDRSAGTISAGMFLKKFSNEYKWAHLDIAGTSWENSGRPYIPKGGTGVGVRLIVQYLVDQLGSKTTNPA